MESLPFNNSWYLKGPPEQREGDLDIVWVWGHERRTAGQDRGGAAQSQGLASSATVGPLAWLHDCRSLASSAVPHAPYTVAAAIYFPFRFLNFDALFILFIQPGTTY